MSDNAVNTNNNTCEEEHEKQNGAEEGTGNKTSSRTKRSIVDVPLRTNISADGQEEEQFK
nr:unnamed protein product [Callosobruchus chinensis]